MPSVSRRQAITLGGAVSVAGMTGLAGCLGGDDGEFPDGSFTIIPPYPEGSRTDALARRMGTEITEITGASHEVEPMGGASSLRGTGELFNRDPDGYTFGLPYVPSAPLATLTNPPGWDIMDLTPIADLGFYTISVATDPEEEFEGMDDVIDRYEDDEYNTVGGLGLGHAWHVAAAVAREEEGWNWNNWVTFDGANDAVRAVAAGEVPVSVVSTSAVGPEYRDGSVDVVANMVSDGDEWLPDVPSWVDDLGYTDIDHISQISFTSLAPPGMDADRQQELIDLTEDVIESDEFQEWAEEDERTHYIGATGDDLADEMQTVLDEIPEQIDLDALLEE